MLNTSCTFITAKIKQHAFKVLSLNVPQPVMTITGNDGPPRKLLRHEQANDGALSNKLLALSQCNVSQF